MAFRIYNNVESLNALRNLNVTQTRLGRSLEKLSSGLKVNTGKDGPAALVISEKLRAQIAGLGQAVENSEQAMSLVQLAEGALAEVNSLLTSIRSLAVHAANEGALDADSLAADQAEITNALETIDRISSSAQYGTKLLLDGSRGVQGSTTDADVTFMSGSDATVAGTYSVDLTVQALQGVATAGTVQTANLGADETVTLNGTNITLTTGMSQVQVRDRINEYNTSTGVTATISAGDELVLTSDAFGSAWTVSAVSNVAAAGVNTSGIGTTVITGTGVDVAGTLGGQVATGKGLVLTGDSGSVVEDLAVSSAGVVGNQGSVTVTQGSLQFQVGANAGQTVKISLPSMAATQLGTGLSSNQFNNLSEINVTSANGASDAIAVIDKAIDHVTSKRGEMGAFQKNTLESYINTLRIARENTIASESVIRDTDFAAEMAEFTKNTILIQSGSSMLAQANQLIPGIALQLLQ
jgi:flagellin